ncbi:MAG: preprotein translocase subunit SecE [Candidatus Ancillula sp.]|jgi:preprotein translocase subunit SecE|nr:preprotein translocase subunit SecE [Candidatus Ancillula sp.]
MTEKAENVKDDDAVVESVATSVTSEGVAEVKEFNGPKFLLPIVTFLRQIINEMKKVVIPTRQELVEYTIVVLVFVLVIMLFITGVDVVIGQIIMFLFAK